MSEESNRIEFHGTGMDHGSSKAGARDGMSRTLRTAAHGIGPWAWHRRGMAGAEGWIGLERSELGAGCRLLDALVRLLAGAGAGAGR